MIVPKPLRLSARPLLKRRLRVHRFSHAATSPSSGVYTISGRARFTLPPKPLVPATYRHTRQDAYTDVLFLADPESLWESAPLLLKEEKGTLPEILTLHPWKDDTVRIWIEDAKLALENPKLRNYIFEITGYWPILLNEIAKKASSSTIDDAFLDRIRGDISIDASRLYSIFFSELDKNSKPLIFLRALAELNEPSNEEDILTWIGLNHEGWDNATVRLAAWWADKLDFIRVHERGWALDPFVMKILTGIV
ncbi:MAG: hypothetical protein GX465_05985 [Acidobacteria bacterium]|nr:hypothetical protein [Acidobacteriota bacterium]